MSIRSGQHWRSNNGSVLVTTLLVLLAITILGVAGINMSVVESKIARTEKEVRETFYLTEGAAMECVQRLIGTDPVDKIEQFPFWFHSKGEAKGLGADFRHPKDWDVDGKGEDNGLMSPMHNDTYIAAVEWRVATGGSLVQTGSRLYQNRAYGLCTRYDINSVIEIGYYMRY